jgi:hypothetical protein
VRLTNDLDSQLGPIVLSSRYIFDLAQGEHPVDDFTENDMLPIEEVALSCCYEELQEPMSGISGTEKVIPIKKLTWQPLVLGPEFAC